MTPEIFNSDTLKIVSAVFMFVGTALVSWRVTVILNAHSFAIEVIDLNEKIRIEKMRGSKIPYIHMYGVSGQVKKAERIGTRLLVSGFFMQIIGIAFNMLSFFV